MNILPIFYNFKSLAEFGYEFNTAGEMRNIQTGEPFIYEVLPGDREYNQRHYEALGEVITEEVYNLLLDRGNLKKVYLDEYKESFVFTSKHFSKAEKLLCLIHGSGVVRAGQWARRLIINNDLDKGTQLPYIQAAIRDGFGVVVFNTNQNTRVEKKSINGRGLPEEHAFTVWNKLILKSAAKSIIIMAHSYGGVVTVNLAGHMKQDFLARVCGVFMTDSVHQGLTGVKRLDKKLKLISKNYVASRKPVGQPVRHSKSDIVCVSAGHEQHEWTSWSAMESIFQDIRAILPVDPQGNLEDERIARLPNPTPDQDSSPQPEQEPSPREDTCLPAKKKRSPNPVENLTTTSIEELVAPISSSPKVSDATHLGKNPEGSDQPDSLRKETMVDLTAEHSEPYAPLDASTAEYPAPVDASTAEYPAPVDSSTAEYPAPVDASTAEYPAPVDSSTAEVPATSSTVEHMEF